MDAPSLVGRVRRDRRELPGAPATPTVSRGRRQRDGTVRPHHRRGRRRRSGRRSSTASTPAPPRRSPARRQELGCRRHPRPLRLAADVPGRRAEAGLARRARARRLRPGAPPVHAQLVARLAADRRLRPGPPLGEPVHPVYDTEARDWYAPWVDGIARRHRAAAAGWPGDVAGRRVTAEASAETGSPAGIPVITGHHRRLVGGDQRRRAPHRRPDADVRHDDVPRPHRRPSR